MKRALIAAAALPLLFACTPQSGNTQSSAAASSSSTVASAPAHMTVQQAAQKWGLIGTWAVDCNQPASPENTHDTYAVESDGSVSLVYDAGAEMEANRYSWTEGNIIEADELQLDGVFFGDNLAQHTVLQKNDQGQMRVFGNVDGKGNVLVQNGSFSNGNGGPPWSNKCS